MSAFHPKQTFSQRLFSTACGPPTSYHVNRRGEHVTGDNAFDPLRTSNIIRRSARPARRLRPRDEPQLIIAALRMPVGNSSVDNFAAGGLASPIDLETGRLGPAVYKDPRKPDVDHHPDSGQQIAGEVVPFWNEVLDLRLHAHRCFPKVATVGWDVALTTEGPKLIEANPGWCVEVVQMAHGKPLGETAWPELLMSHAR